jgi:hypothetical protein
MPVFVHASYFSALRALSPTPRKLRMHTLTASHSPTHMTTRADYSVLVSPVSSYFSYDLGKCRQNIHYGVMACDGGPTLARRAFVHLTTNQYIDPLSPSLRCWE